MLHSDEGLTVPKVVQFSNQLYESGCRASHLLAFLADSGIEMIEKQIGNPMTHMKHVTKVTIFLFIITNVGKNMLKNIAYTNRILFKLQKFVAFVKIR